MNYTNDNVKKICNFYMSDWHFTVMILPYINKEINKNTKVITILEKDMTDKVEMLVDKLNIKNKSEILKINWKNSNINSFEKELENNLQHNEDNLLIINGTNNYIKEVNYKIDEELHKEEYSQKKVKILDCFDFDSNKDNMRNILKNYDGMLNTSGETKVRNIF